MATDPQKIADITTAMRESGVREDSISIVLAVLAHRSFKKAAEELGMTQGRVQHRVFEACKLVEANGKAWWSKDNPPGIPC